jgi:expansin (peptidoglycan-binding protein)
MKTMRIHRSAAPRALYLAGLILGVFNGCADKAVTVREPEIQGCPDAPVVHTGEATYYTFASGGGSCMFDPTPNDLMVGAMNNFDYAGAGVCGQCVSISGPRATITVRIVDRCPECAQGWIDLSPQAFSAISDLILGHAPITWYVAPCQVSGPIVYHFKDGSNQWWTAVQIRNHRNPVSSLEYRTGQGTFKTVNRTEYNYFVEPAGMGPGPFTFRVTDIYGHTLVDSGVVHIENGNVTGQNQFPPCP